METEGEKMEYRTVEPQRDPKFLRLPDRESFDKIVARANDGEAEALSALHRLLDQHPQIWRQVGDLNRHAVTTLVNMIADGNTLLQQSIAKSTEQLVSDLTETETPSMMEQLLIRAYFKTVPTQRSSKQAVQIRETGGHNARIV